MDTLLNGIKDLSNQLMIPIVAAGVIEARQALKVDPQLENRFQVEQLEPWHYNTKEEKVLFKQLLRSIESRLPLEEPSNLFKG